MTNRIILYWQIIFIVACVLFLFFYKKPINTSNNTNRDFIYICNKFPPNGTILFPWMEKNCKPVAQYDR